ncbi:MAG: extracellular solute-binding protein [Clostridiales bacterium]|nr:extracellular solute-binding protein [Clostridiales bacterium]
MKTKKLLVLALAIALIVSSIGFAGAEGNLSAAGEYPIWTGDEPAVISVLVAPSDYVTDWDDNAYTKKIEELCNVDLQFVFLPATDGGDKLNIMISTGEKLPDVLNYNLNTALEKSYAEAGALVNLQPYYESGLGYNVSKAVEQFPDWNLLTNITSPDGGIYGVPRIQVSPSNETKYKMWVNEAWLKNLNLEVPTTTDAFYEMLKAFKEQDANGDGDATNEIPFITSTGWGGTATKFLTNAFVFEGDGDMFLLKDGHVSVSYIQDGWFDSVEYLKKLCDEGLLAKESFTYSNTDLLAVAGTDEDVVGVMTNSSLAFMGAGDDPYRLRYICIAPLTGPDGVKYTAYSQSATNSQWHVTTYAENPELCFRVGDAQFTEEFFLAGRFGVENENWMTSENYLKANPGEEIAARYEAMGYEGHYVFYNDVRGTPNNLNWYDPMPYFSGTVECEGAYVSKAADGTVTGLENNCTIRQETASGVYQLCKPGSDVYVPNLAFTDEELEEISESLSTIKAYVNEQRTNYIIGEESDLADSQKFIDNLKSSFNLDKILEIADTAYQRQYAAK